MERVRRVLKNIIDVIKKPEMRVLPGQLAFFFVISLIPLIALIGVIASSFSISLDVFMDTYIEIIPDSVSKLLLSIIDNNGLNFNILVFFVSAFFLASNGPHSIIITSNEIYKIKSKNVVNRRIKAILMTLIMVCLLMFLLVFSVFGNLLYDMVNYASNNGVSINYLYNILIILKYPLSIIVVYLNIKLLYVVAPDKKIESNSTTYGALFTTISWVISTEIYSIYVGKFSKYSIFYGSISNILVLLLWVYLLSYIFVLGMAFNAGNTLDIRQHNKTLKK